MNDLLVYAYESGISLAALYGLYWVFLRKETYFQFNRLFLLSTIIFACLIPFINFGPFEINSKTSSLSLIAGMGEAVRLPEVIVAGGSRNILNFSENCRYLVIIIYFLFLLELLKLLSRRNYAESITKP